MTNPTVAEMLTTIAERCCTFSLNVNEPRAYYEDVPPDAVWRMQVYWNTPVGFIIYEGTTLDEVVDAAHRDAEGRGPWTSPYTIEPAPISTFDECELRRKSEHVPVSRINANSPVSDLSVGTRAQHVMRDAGIITVWQLVSLTNHAIRRLRNCGRKTRRHLHEALVDAGFTPVWRWNP